MKLWIAIAAYSAYQGQPQPVIGFSPPQFDIVAFFQRDEQDKIDDRKFVLDM